MKRLMSIALISGLALIFTLDAKSEEHGSDAPPLTLKSLAPAPHAPARKIHPLVKFLDEQGIPVIQSGGALSLKKTCGACHDADYIERHNYHAQAGLDEMFNPGDGPRPWDLSPGMFGRWDPLTYRTLTTLGESKLDMGAADWIMTMGARHVGGGPAVYSRNKNIRLDQMPETDSFNPEAFHLDPATGKPAPWDWKKSGTVELNCLICHMREPNNSERVREIKEGRFRWASTATLAGSSLVERVGPVLNWLSRAFDSEGRVVLSSFSISDPDSDNCRMCHGKACSCTDPVVFQNSLDNWSVETTGEVFSPSQMFKSGMNLKGKDNLSRSWDVHAERLFECSYCHYSMNNPQYLEKEKIGGKPEHLVFDARKLGLNEYLLKPDHNLAKGHNAQGTVAKSLQGSMRDCRDCHNAYAAHEFLPYKKLHFEKLSCQVCHISQVHAPARMSTDWTMITADGRPLVSHRGIEGQVNAPRSLITGYRPALLQHERGRGEYRLGPHNLISSWFWVEGDPEQPVRLFDLKQAFLDGKGAYKLELVKAFDMNRNGSLTEEELRLDTKEKVDLAARLLTQVGVENPRIKSEVQPYTLSHGAATGEFALRDCHACHSYDSRITEKITLADYAPGGVMPAPVSDSGVQMIGKFTTAGAKDPRLVYEPSIDPDLLYIHGADRIKFLDIIGILAVIGSVIGVAGHGGLRVVSSVLRKKGKAE